MNKQIHFLSGLYRSGNTVLSALLNQHPEIYVSPISPLSSLLWANEVTAANDENIKRNDENQTRFHRVQQSYAQTLYADVDKPIILDREKDWGHPANINLAVSYVSEFPKIVITVRDIVDVIGSYIAIHRDLLVREADAFDVFSLQYKDEVEAIADYLMRPNGNIQRTLFSIANALRTQQVSTHLVEYEDLVFMPEKVMSETHAFLGATPFINDFNNIVKIEQDNDVAAGHNADLHVVRKTLSKRQVSYRDVLPKSIVRRYSDMEFWRQ